ncbi:MAG: helix-turn-helix transcriptional regulator [Bacillota bacterium]
MGDKVGASIPTYREQRGWSLSELSRRSGVSKGYLHELERGDAEPTVGTLSKLAAVVEVRAIKYRIWKGHQAATRVAGQDTLMGG